MRAGSSGPASGPGRQRLGERLVAAGLIAEARVEAALRAQRLVRGRLGHQLVRLGEISPSVLSEFLEGEIAAGRLEAPLPPRGAPGLAALPARLAHLYNVYPVAVAGSRLDLAVPPLHGQHVIDAVAEATGLVVEPLVLPARALRHAIERDYLGSPRAAVLEPPSGLPTLLVEDDLRQLRPLAPDLRAGELSAEAFLRSVLAEAVHRRARVIDLALGESRSRLAFGGEEAPLPPPTELPRDVGVTLLRLARPLDLLATGTPRGRFLARLLGRRLSVRTSHRASDPDAWRLVLSEERFGTDDVDELFASAEAARAGVEELVTAGRGLLLIASAGGAGGRALVRLLGDRIAETLPRGVRVTDTTSGPASSFSSVVAAATDHEAAQGVQAAADEDSSFLAIDEVLGPRTLERALLAAARRPVLAALPVADEAAALSWIARQGLLGALKTGLLRGVISALATTPSCACAVACEVPRDLLSRWGMAGKSPAAKANRGCPACDDGGPRRASLVLQWLPVEAAAVTEFAVGDEAEARSRARAAGRTPLLDAALALSARGDADAGEVCHLLATEGV